MKIEDAIHSTFSSPQLKAIVNIRYTSNFLGHYQNSFMVQYDLSMPQFNILRILRGAKGDINVNKVKERMIEKSPNTTRLMDKLIDKGLIERTRCAEDRRVVYVKITKHGLDLLSEIDNHMDVNTLIKAELTDEEANQLSGLLDKVREKYEATR
ncbi:MAG: MarR family winged helix-turn-helix transcriptional regulator [Flavobacteriales bacterium]|jgi:MarR family 2-MHQ and catechol resistance regulon transcriptional repressor